jgi:DNA modification methylase
MTYQILQGNCIETLKALAPESVQTCVTSPPYFGLRDYGTAQWMGGDPECNHQYQKGGRNPETSAKQISSAGTTFSQYEKVCKRCGALRIDDQIGLEETPEQYVDKLVQVFREVRRVLSSDGTLWLNLGDSYAGAGGMGSWVDGKAKRGMEVIENYNRKSVPGCKPKDLIGIPWMVAFALRADGWYLRSEIIWHKRNPMPEPVTDRPTKAHEQIFLLSKNAQYYCDMDAIREPYETPEEARYRPRVYTTKSTGNNPDAMPDSKPFGERFDKGGKNCRDVWSLVAEPYPGAHFATFPTEIPRRCIFAGSRAGDTVLDPFNGSGTTGAVAIKHHRHYVGCELNPDYITLTHKRFMQVQPILFEVPA